MRAFAVISLVIHVALASMFAINRPDTNQGVYGVGEIIQGTYNNIFNYTRGSSAKAYNPIQGIYYSTSIINNISSVIRFDVNARTMLSPLSVSENATIYTLTWVEEIEELVALLSDDNGVVSAWIWSENGQDYRDITFQNVTMGMLGLYGAVASSDGNSIVTVLCQDLTTNVRSTRIYLLDIEQETFTDTSIVTCLNDQSRRYIPRYLFLDHSGSLRVVGSVSDTQDSGSIWTINNADGSCTVTDTLIAPNAYSVIADAHYVPETNMIWFLATTNSDGDMLGSKDLTSGILASSQAISGYGASLQSFIVTSFNSTNATVPSSASSSSSLGSSASGSSSSSGSLSSLASSGTSTESSSGSSSSSSTVTLASSSPNPTPSTSSEDKTSYGIGIAIIVIVVILIIGVLIGCAVVLVKRRRAQLAQRYRGPEDEQGGEVALDEY